MKLTIAKSILHQAIKEVLPFASRSSNSMTTEVLLHALGGNLSLTTNNLMAGITVELEADVLQSGETCIDARLLSQVVAAMPPGELSIEQTINQAHRKTIILKSGKQEYTLIADKPEDYPPIHATDGQTVELKPALLKEAFRKTYPWTCREDSTPVLTGVLMEAIDGKLSFVSADGFRLSVYRMPCEATFKALIPRFAANQVQRLIYSKTESVMLTVSSERALFQIDNKAITTQLVQGIFPAYGQLIPKEHMTKITVNTAEFLRAVKAAGIIARRTLGIVRFFAVGGGLIIKSSAEEYGEYSHAIEAQVESKDGKEAKIAFNYLYLADMCAAIGSEELTLEINTESAPGVFKPIGADNYLCVVMPMYVQW